MRVFMTSSDVVSGALSSSPDIAPWHGPGVVQPHLRKPRAARCHLHQRPGNIVCCQVITGIAGSAGRPGCRTEEHREFAFGFANCNSVANWQRPAGDGCTCERQPVLGGLSSSLDQAACHRSRRSAVGLVRPCQPADRIDICRLGELAAIWHEPKIGLRRHCWPISTVGTDLKPGAAHDLSAFEG